MSELTLFEPKVSDMRMDYPELAEYSEFKPLTARELKLCWYVGNRTSPIAKYKKATRYTRGIEMSFGKVAKKREDVKKMLEGDLPDHILLGIQRMATFNPSVRLRAKFSTEYIFDRLNEIIEVSQRDMEAMDFDERKKYSELIIKISSEMPDMVKRMEGGYGVKVTAKGRTRRKTEVTASISDLKIIK